MADLEMIAGGEKLDSEYLANMLTTSTDEARLLRMIDLFRDYLSEYEFAMKACERFFEIRQARPQEENEMPGYEYNELAITYLLMEKKDEALEWMEKYKEIRLSVGGPDDPELLGIYNNIAMIYDDDHFGKYDEAFEMYEKVEKILMKSSPQHPLLATLYTNMANVYAHRGDNDGAAKMCEKAREISVGLYGPEHRDVAMTWANEGEIRHKQGRYEEAVELYEKGVKLLVMALGPHHPWVQQAEKQIADAREGKYFEGKYYG
mmetsp:Transcript_25532/g.62707  ORF Transcript_25532/g.62707 Transcript_25532/m.62707 type:complete len:262 (-) Transcript_25532:48-833(-)